MDLWVCAVHFAFFAFLCVVCMGVFHEICADLSRNPKQSEKLHRHWQGLIARHWSKQLPELLDRIGELPATLADWIWLKLYISFPQAQIKHKPPLQTTTDATFCNLRYWLFKVSESAGEYIKTFNAKTLLYLCHTANIALTVVLFYSCEARSCSAAIVVPICLPQKIIEINAVVTVLCLFSPAPSLQLLSLPTCVLTINTHTLLKDTAEWEESRRTARDDVSEHNNNREHWYWKLRSSKLFSPFPAWLISNNPTPSLTRGR